MTKILALGDTHGRTTWKEFVKEEYDKIIFIGDYFDSFNISGDKQINNFRDIIEYKKKNLDKVILLIGNHDFHYLDMGERYSGFQKGYQYMIKDLLESNLKYIQMAYHHHNFLFTHAGVTNTWADANNIDLLGDIDGQINDLFTYQPRKFAFTGGPKNDGYGNEITQTPIWVRPESLRQDGIEEVNHVVGHTATPNIKINDNVILIDVLDYAKEALQIIDGQPSIIKL